MSTRRRPSSQDVARLAGVSRTTVSFVLNDAPGASISAATRRRVLEAAEELGYVPSAAARSLASGRTWTLGLVVCHAHHLTTDAIIPQALFSLNEVSRRAGFRVLVEALEDVARPGAYLQMVHSKQIDGLLVINPRSDDSQLPRLVRSGFPLVTMGNPPGDEGYRVDIDNVSASRGAVGHLLRAGRRAIAYVSYSEPHYRSSDERHQGYREALDGAGVPFDPALVAHGSYSAASGYAAMRRLLLEGAALDAVFCGNDTVAFGVMTALREAGRRIPEDVAVVGFDDIPMAAHAVPPLTTVANPAVQSGRRAAEMIIALVHGEEVPEPVVILPSPLVVRRSCGVAQPVAAQTGPVETGPARTGPAGTGAAGTRPAETGPAETGPAKAGPPEAGPATEESAEAGSTRAAVARAERTR